MKFVITLISLFALPAFSHDMPVVKIAPQFEKMKALVGTWEGKNKMHGKEMDTKVVYELTSGGTALMEKLNPGTPHEMVTMYASSGDKVTATHFCMAGNQPQMLLKKSTGDHFEFELDGTKGLSNKNEMHMHSVALTLTDKKLKQEWTNFANNKKSEVAIFEFTKK